jgi:hypothetical protein
MRKQADAEGVSGVVCGRITPLKDGPSPDASTSEPGPNRRPGERNRG